jgi:hypothetical protein
MILSPTEIINVIPHNRIVQTLSAWISVIKSDSGITLLFTGSLKGITEEPFEERAQMRLKYKKQRKSRQEK